MENLQVTTEMSRSSFVVNSDVSRQQRVISQDNSFGEKLATEDPQIELINSNGQQTFDSHATTSGGANSSNPVNE